MSRQERLLHYNALHANAQSNCTSNSDLKYSEEKVKHSLEEGQNHGIVQCEESIDIPEAETHYQRISLDDSKSITKLIYRKFKMLPLVNHLVREMSDSTTILESDDSTPLCEGSSISKGQWAREFDKIANKYLLPKEAENGILNLLYNTFGQESNLPVTLTVNGRNGLQRQVFGQADNDMVDENLSAQNAVSAVKKYCRKISRWMQFQQCQNDCCVFIGKLYNQFSCPKCKSPRYRPCTRSECGGKGTEHCAHLLNDGIAYKSLYYRLLIPLLVDLINTKYFVSALHFQNERMESSNGCEEFYADILDGEVAKEHLISMDNNFKAWCKENTTVNSDFIPINLLLMEFYDGGQLFKYATCNFWGLFTSILNLPPTYRGKVGISQFLSAIYGGTHSTAEKFLFTDLYCEELRALYEGYEYTSPSGKRYFIQARLIFHSMDTKALEPILGMQSMSNSRYGCPYCRNCHGQQNSWKVCFTGHRNFLPKFHWFRFFGQSGKCCPLNFYEPKSDSLWFDDEEFLNDTNPVTAESLLEQLKGRARTFANMTFCEPCDQDQARGNEIKEFLLDKTSAYSWIHNDNGFDFKDISKNDKGLRDNIFFRHFDFRPQVTYRRINKEEHLHSALEARDRNRNHPLKGKKHHVHGFQDVWAFDRLPYSDLARNSSPPPDHAIKGVISHLVDYVFGFYKEKKPSKRKYERKSTATKKKKEEKSLAEVELEVEEEEFIPKYRPSYFEKRAPYSCTNKQFERTNAWLSCVLIPVGVVDRSDWVLDFNKSGIFKIAQWKNVASVFWDFIIYSLPQIDQWYRILYRMAGNAIRDILSFWVHRGSIDDLQLRVAEMLSLWESSFQASENYFQLHQIMELVSSIPLFGSTHSWSDLLGEKALGYLKKIKKKSNPGGRSYEKNIIRRHVDQEISTLNKFYSASVNFTDKTAPNYKTKVWFDDEHDIIKFNAAQFAIQKPEKIAANFPFNAWEINILVEVLLREIRKRYDGDEAQCIENSYLYSAICHVGKRFPRQTHSQLLNTIVDNDDCCPREEVLVAQSLLSFKPMFHSQAWIYGLQFRSRGSMYREYLFELPQKVRAISETYSAREVPWNCKKNYSSWCMFQQSDFNSLNTPHSYRYGRINSFFAINIGDKSIDGLLLASVTSHKFERVAINVDKVTNSESLDPHTIFIALQDIYPTLIATIPFASNGLATRTSRKQNVDPKHVNAFERNLQLMYSIMLKMNPDKLSCFPSKRPWTIYLSKENGRLPTTTVANTPLHANSEHSKLNHKCFPLERCSSRPTGGVFYSSSSYWTNQKRSSSTEDELLQSKDTSTSIGENENLRTCLPQAMKSITSSSAMTSSLTGDELMKTSFAPPTNANRPFPSMISAKPTSSYGYESSNFRGTSNTSASAINSSSAMNHTTSNGNESSNLNWTSNTSSSAMTSSLTGDELMKTSFAPPTKISRI